MTGIDSDGAVPGGYLAHPLCGVGGEARKQRVAGAAERLGASIPFARIDKRRRTRQRDPFIANLDLFRCAWPGAGVAAATPRHPDGCPRRAANSRHIARGLEGVLTQCTPAATDPAGGNMIASSTPEVASTNARAKPIPSMRE